jgi:hypothetical protein
MMACGAISRALSTLLGTWRGTHENWHIFGVIGCGQMNSGPRRTLVEPF